MRKYLRYIVGFFLILVGLGLKMTLNHHVDFWATIKTISMLLFAIGLVALNPFENSQTKTLKQQSLIRKTLTKSGNVLLLVLLFAAVLGLEKIGVQLNYKLRDHFLSFDTKTTVGYRNGTKRINLVKVGHADFYLINYKANNENQSNGLRTKYADWDSESEKQNVKDEKEFRINNLKRGQVKILYSKKHPSFFKIIE